MPAQVGSCAISAVHWVMARTKTRSKNNSSGATRSPSRSTAANRGARAWLAVVIPEVCPAASSARDRARATARRAPPSARLRARSARLALGVLPQRLGELGLAHVRAPVDARLLGVLVELLLGLVGVHAAVGLLGPLARRAAALLGLRVRGSLLVLELPVVALLLGDVLDRGVRRAVGALLAVVLLLGAVERLGVGPLDLLGRARDRARQVFLLRRHGLRLPAAGAPDAPGGVPPGRRRRRRAAARGAARGGPRRGGGDPAPGPAGEGRGGERVPLPRPQVEAVSVALRA